MRVTLQNITDQSNLERAWIRAKAYAQSYHIYYDVERYEQFEKHLGSNLRVLGARLLKGYKPDPLLGIRTSKADGHRDLYMLTVWDNVASIAFLNVLAPEVEHLISERSADLSFGNRFNLSDTNEVLLDWRDQHSYFSAKLREITVLPDDYWYLRSDIANYYPSVDTGRVLTLLAPFLERETYDLISAFLSLQGRIRDGQPVEVQGLPIGPAYSHLFANLYLADFDAWMREGTIGYVRYVDDFFYACSSEPELLTHRDEIVTRLSSIGLQMHPGKTERYPVADTSCIEDTIRRLKYDIRIEAPELKAANLEEQAEKLLYEAFIDSEYFKTPETTAFVAWTLADLGYSDVGSLSKMVCEVLEVGSLKPSEIRRLLSFVISKNENGLPQQLLDYLVGTDDAATRLISLDIIDDFPKCAHEHCAELFNAFRSSDSFLVRAYVYAVFANCLINHVLLRELIQLLSEEDNAFVRSKLVFLLIRLHPEEIAVELPYWLNDAPEVSSAILESADLLSSRVVTRALIPSLHFSDICSVHFSAYVYLLLLQSLKAELDDFLETQEIITDEVDLIESVAGLAQEAFEWLLERQEHYACYELLEMIIKIDPSLAVGSFDRLRRQTRTDGSAVAHRIADTIDEAFRDVSEESRIWSFESQANPRTVFLQQYRIEEDLVPWKPSRNGLYEVTCLDTGQRGLLELLPAAKLASHGLSSRALIDMVTELSASRICCQTDFGETEMHPEVAYVWLVYRYPEDWAPLAEMVGLSHSSIEERVRTIVCVVQLLNLSQEATRFQSINTRSIIASGAQDIRLCGIGTSIIDPTYLFSGTRDVWQEGLGAGNLSFCLGLLLYEYLTGESPYLYLQATKRKQHALHKEGMANLSRDQGIPPHVQYVFTRATADQVEHRYSGIQPLADDLEHVHLYLKKLSRYAVAKPGDSLKLLEIADYIEFRFKVIWRSPLVGRTRRSPIDRRQRAGEELLKDIMRFLPTLDLKPDLIMRTSSKAVTAPYRIRYSSPAAQQLVKLAEFLWGVTEEANTQFNASYAPQVSILLLMKMLDFESALLVYSLAMCTTNTEGHLESLTAKIESWLDIDDVSEAWIETDQSTRDRVRVEMSPARLQRLARVMAGSSAPKKVIQHLYDLTDVAILTALYIQGLHLCLDDERCSGDQLWLQSRVKQDLALNLALMAGALEGDLHTLLTEDAEVDPMEICRRRIWPAFRLINRIRPTRRVHGKIAEFDRVQQQGSLRWRKLLAIPDKCKWQQRSTLHFGLEPWKLVDSPAAIDFSCYNKEVLAVTNQVSRIQSLKLDTWLRRIQNVYKSHPLIWHSAIVVLVGTVVLFIGGKTGYGVLGSVFELTLIVLGLTLDTLLSHARERLDPDANL